MRIAVISDIHGNLEAFRETLADIERTGAETVVSLGDNVGYGADPEEVSRLIRSLKIFSVMGNHELGIARPEHLSWFNEFARESLILTRRLISEETLVWLSTLPTSLVLDGGHFVHGAPPDSVTEYIFEMTDSNLKRRMSRITERICFVGHTHIPELICIRGASVYRPEMGKGAVPLEEDARYIIDVGSVGQPRDGNNNAKYVIWDNTGKTVELRYVPYDIAAAAKKIIQLGFPRINADRLR